MCVNGCKLYYPGDNSFAFSYCKEARYESETSSGGVNQVVKKNYQIPLSRQLAEFLSYESNITKINNYKKLVAESHLQAPKHLYKDIFDGQAHFEPKENTELTLALHIDEFNPFKRESVSMTIVKATLLDLPPEDRVKRENIFIIAVIPGPKKSRRTYLAFCILFFKIY